MKTDKTILEEFNRKLRTRRDCSGEYKHAALCQGCNELIIEEKEKVGEFILSALKEQREEIIGVIPRKKGECKTPKQDKKRTSVQEFVDTIQDNPQEIIAWAKREIKEYQRLIKILEKKI